MPGGAGTGFKGDISRGNTDVVVSVEQRINPDTTDKFSAEPYTAVWLPAGRYGQMNFAPQPMMKL